MKTLGTIYRDLPVKLTEQELLAKGDELAHLVHDLARELKDQAELRKAAKERRQEIEEKIAAAARVVETGAEERPVRCEEHIDGTTTVAIFRLDTGEVVGSRLLTDDERQVVLFPVASAEAER